MIAIYVVIIHNTLAKYNTINKQKLVPQKLCEKKRNNDVYCSNFFDNKIDGEWEGGHMSWGKPFWSQYTAVYCECRHRWLLDLFSYGFAMRIYIGMHSMPKMKKKVQLGIDV